MNGRVRRHHQCIRDPGIDITLDGIVEDGDADGTADAEGHGNRGRIGRKIGIFAGGHVDIASGEISGNVTV